MKTELFTNNEFRTFETINQNIYMNNVKDFLHESEYKEVTRKIDSGKIKHKLKDMKKIISGRFK